jgi:hypothetical protein
LKTSFWWFLCKNWLVSCSFGTEAENSSESPTWFLFYPSGVLTSLRRPFAFSQVYEGYRDLDEVAGATDAIACSQLVGSFLGCEIPDLNDDRLHRASPLPATIRFLELPRRSNGETGIENP